MRALLIARNASVGPDLLIMRRRVCARSVSAHAERLSHLPMYYAPWKQLTSSVHFLRSILPDRPAHNVRFSRFSSNRNIENP